MTRWLAAACILLTIALAACAEKEARPAVTAEPAEPAQADNDGLVFELLIGRVPDDERQGLRILGDGRAQARGNQLPRIDDAGRVQLDRVDLKWRDVWKYTPEELDRVRAVVAGAARGLQPRYDVEQGKSPTGDLLTWRLRSGDRLVETEVDGAPFATPAALDQLYKRLPALHERPVERTVWRVWTGDRVVERHADCPVAKVPELATLRNVLFNPDSIPPTDTPPAGEDPPPGTPLAEVEFLLPDSRYVSRFYADGRREETRPEGERKLEDMNDDHLAAIRAAIVDSGFAALPEPVC